MQRIIANSEPHPKNDGDNDCERFPIVTLLSNCNCQRRFLLGSKDLTERLNQDLPNLSVSKESDRVHPFDTTSSFY